MARSGQEALEVMEALTEEEIEVAMIIPDHIMPRMKGDELLKEVHHRYPKTLMVLLTARVDTDTVGNVVNEANLYKYGAESDERKDFRGERHR